jgi:hypothetical protein
VRATSKWFIREYSSRRPSMSGISPLNGLSNTTTSGEATSRIMQWWTITSPISRWMSNSPRRTHDSRRCHASRRWGMPLRWVHNPINREVHSKHHHHQYQYHSYQNRHKWHHKFQDLYVLINLYIYLCRSKEGIKGIFQYVVLNRNRMLRSEEIQYVVLNRRLRSEEIQIWEKCREIVGAEIENGIWEWIRWRHGGGWDAPVCQMNIFN